MSESRFWREIEETAAHAEQSSRTPMGSGLPQPSRLKPGQAVTEAEKVLQRRTRRRGIHVPNPFSFLFGTGREKPKKR